MRFHKSSALMAHIFSDVVQLHLAIVQSMRHYPFLTFVYSDVSPLAESTLFRTALGCFDSYLDLMNFPVILHKPIKSKAKLEAVILSHSLLLYLIICLSKILGPILFIGFNQRQFDILSFVAWWWLNRILLLLLFKTFLFFFLFLPVCLFIQTCSDLVLFRGNRRVFGLLSLFWRALLGFFIFQLVLLDFLILLAHLFVTILLLCLSLALSIFIAILSVFFFALYLCLRFIFPLLLDSLNNL